MRIVISGSSGLIGKALTADLTTDGHQVLRLVRSASADPGTATWDPAAGILDPELLSGADAVVNLNGRNVGDGRWTPSVKAELRSSRIDATRTVVAAISAAPQPPPVLVNASAVGYYGDRGDQILDEASPAGEGFLADLSREWEECALTARQSGTRVVLLRFGMVVGRGGAVAKMLTPFRLGIGGPMGSGKQWWPWVAMEDVVGTLRFSLENDEAEGPINVVSPSETRCREFTSELGRALNRPAFLPMPAFAARLALGGMADGLLLASTRVRPAALERLGYGFRVPKLDAAIAQALD